ncbi:hypothetical protein V1288_005287 [Bradyrhizobium sp. AZCC 2176]
MTATKAKGAPQGAPFAFVGQCAGGKSAGDHGEQYISDSTRCGVISKRSTSVIFSFDEVVVEHAAMLEEGAVLVEIFHWFTSDDVVTGHDVRAQRPAAAPVWIRLPQYSRPSAPARMPAA